MSVTNAGLYRESQVEMANARAVREKYEAQKAARLQNYETKIELREESDAKASAKAKQKWRQVAEQGRALIEEAARGYDGLVQALLAQANCDKFCAAMRASMPLTWMLGKLFLPVVDYLGCRFDEAYDGGSNMLESLFGGETPFTLPHLQYFIELNDDDTLAVHSLRNNLVVADDAAFTPEQKESMDVDFEEGVIDWIETADGNRYELERVAGTESFKVLDTTTGTHLDQAAFKALRDSPEHGFNAALERRFNIKLEQIEAPTPTAAPGI